jgi:hypothetical protein
MRIFGSRKEEVRGEWRKLRQNLIILTHYHNLKADHKEKDEMGDMGKIKNVHKISLQNA